MYNKQTPWTKKTTSASNSLPSDRLRPKPTPASSQSRNSQTPQEPALPQSKALRTLHALRASLQNPSTSTAPDTTGGCFCQARTHPLSQYVPICASCALPLCNLAAPAHPCPSCQEPLITLTQRNDLIARIETEIADTTRKEQLARERAEEARRAAAGAFPTLSTPSSAYPTPSHSQSPSPRPQAPPQPQTHKVLSLNSKTKKTILTTTTVKPKVSAASSPQGSRPTSPQPTREPRPDAHLLDRSGKGKGKAQVNPTRTWENLNGDVAVYVPPVLSVDDVDADAEGKTTGKRRRGRGKGKGKAVAEDGKENVQAGLSVVGEGSGS
ncbi:hypothetical protein DXG01_013509 [Tephrocybe rancida]|nr:hypothetical protein DXG01_013509 [Tephrocybe rancida]